MNIITSSSFCDFLSAFNSLVRKKLDARNVLQNNIEKIFENHRQIDDIIAKLYEKSAEVKARSNSNQKIYDDFLMQQMQAKRDYEDIEEQIWKKHFYRKGTPVSKQ